MSAVAAVAAKAAVPLAPLDEARVRQLDMPGPRYTSYPTVPVWTPNFGAEAHARALASAGKTPLSLYVHIPFCERLCSYCGCNVVVSHDRGRAGRYLDLVARELELVAQHLGKPRTLTRIHLGGGTPTFLDENQLEQLWSAITAVFSVERDAELAIEIDPVVTRREQLALLHGLGWNRLSMGVQDFDPRVQDAVQRFQSVEDTRAMVDCARALGWGSVNFDLIYGLPRQTPESWRRTIDQVIELSPDRIAAFSFAYLPALRKQQRRLPQADLPLGAAKLELFRIAYQRLTDAGYVPIGMDHFARPDDELARAQAEGKLWRDFQGYTTRRDADTVAVGVTGISRVGGAFAQNVKSLTDYRVAIELGQLPTERGHVLSADDRERSDIITELMCNFALELTPERRARFAPELARLEQHASDGLCEIGPYRLEVTALGRMFVRNLAMVFDAYLEPGKGAFSRTV